MNQDKKKPFSHIKNLPKVTVISFDGGWDAIYVDGQRIHWHDSVDADDLLHMLGIPTEDVVYSTDEIQAALQAKVTGHNARDSWGDYLPNTLLELNVTVARHQQQLVTAEIAELRAKADKLEAGLKEK